MVTYNVHSTFMYILTILYISEQKGQKSSSSSLLPPPHRLHNRQHGHRHNQKQTSCSQIQNEKEEFRFRHARCDQV